MDFKCFVLFTLSCLCHCLTPNSRFNFRTVVSLNIHLCKEDNQLNNTNSSTLLMGTFIPYSRNPLVTFAYINLFLINAYAFVVLNRIVSVHIINNLIL